MNSSGVIHPALAPCSCGMILSEKSATFRGHARALASLTAQAQGSAKAVAGGNLMPLKDKTLFISGGSRGIGLAIALRAARDGANVTIAAKTAEPHPKLPGTIHTAAEEIEKAGGKALPVVCDIRDETQVGEAVEKTVERFGGIDICVNN